MKKIDEHWLCDDCVIAAANGDYTSLDYHYDPEEAATLRKAIEEGLEKLGPNLVCDSNVNASAIDVYPREAWVEAVVADDTDEGWEKWALDMVDANPGYDEFSRDPCDCCGTTLAGSRTRFATLGEE